MRIVGVAATGLAAVIAAVTLVIGVQSIPDIKRYLKMRSM
jgi:hypothetical protein